MFVNQSKITDKFNYLKYNSGRERQFFVITEPLIKPCWTLFVMNNFEFINLFNRFVDSSDLVVHRDGDHLNVLGHLQAEEVSFKNNSS